MSNKRIFWLCGLLFFLSATNVLAERKSTEPIAAGDYLTIFHGIYGKPSDSDNRFQILLDKAIQEMVNATLTDDIIPPVFKQKLKSLKQEKFEEQTEINIAEFLSLIDNSEETFIPDLLESRLKKLPAKGMELAMELVSPSEEQPATLRLRGYIIIRFESLEPYFQWFDETVPIHIYYDEYLKNFFKREIIRLLSEPFTIEMITLEGELSLTKIFDKGVLSKGQIQKVELNIEKLPVSKYYLQGCEYSLQCLLIKKRSSVDIFTPDSDLIYTSESELAEKVCEARGLELIDEKKLKILKALEIEKNFELYRADEPIITKNGVINFYEKYKDYNEKKTFDKGLVWCVSKDDEIPEIQTEERNFSLAIDFTFGFFPNGEEEKTGFNYFSLGLGYLTAGLFREIDYGFFRLGYSSHAMSVVLNSDTVELTQSAPFLFLSAAYYPFILNLFSIDFILGGGLQYNYYIGEKISLSEFNLEYLPPDYYEYYVSIGTEPYGFNGWFYSLQLGGATSGDTVSQAGLALRAGYLFY